MIAGFLAAATLQAGVPGAEPAYTVRIEGWSGPGCLVERTFAFHRGDRGRWLVQRTETNQYICKGYKRLWIDSRSCPALASVVAEIPQQLANPSAQDNRPVFDAPNVTLEGRTRSGAMVRRTDTTGPLAAWWYRSLESLEPCWRRSGPDQAG